MAKAKRHVTHTQDSTETVASAPVTGVDGVHDEELVDLFPHEPVLEGSRLGADEQMVAELTQERDTIKDQLVRAMADLQNARRRAQQEREDMRRFATESLVRDLLPVLDNFERTLAAADQGAAHESLIEGVRMVDKQLRQVLEGVAVKRIVALGASFDPELHEAIGSEPREDVEEGTVTLEMEPGYVMNHRVIRPSRVRVATRP